VVPSRDGDGIQALDIEWKRGRRVGHNLSSRDVKSANQLKFKGNVGSCGGQSSHPPKLAIKAYSTYQGLLKRDKPWQKYQ